MPLARTAAGNVPAPSARRSLLIVAAPFGFGPAAKAWLLAEALKGTHDIRVSAPGDAFVFLKRVLDPAIQIRDGRFSQDFPTAQSLAPFDAVISINQVLALVHLHRLGLAHRSIFVDSLTRWRTDVEGLEVPGGLLAHLVQDYPALDGAGAALPVGAVPVAPIVWPGDKVNASARRGIVIHTGGMAPPLAGDSPIDQAIRQLFGPVLAEASRQGEEVSLLGNPNAIAKVPGADAVRVLGAVSPSVATDAIGGARVLVTTPGIGAVYEALSRDTPVILLPPTNSTQMFHYEVLTGLGIAGTLDAEAHRRLIARMEGVAWTGHSAELMSFLAEDGATLISRLADGLSACLDPARENERSGMAVAGRRIFESFATLRAGDAIADAVASLPARPAAARPRMPARANEAPEDPRARLIASLPKVELHLHLEGALPPAFVMELARRNGIPLPFADPEDFFRPRSFPDFRDFANRLLFNAHCLRTPRDFSDAVAALGPLLAHSNIRFAEVMWTPQLYLDRGLPLDHLLGALNHGRARLKERHGIELRWIVDLVRSYPEPALKVAQWASRPAIRTAGVVALGLGGPEKGHSAHPFARSFATARQAGIAANPHAGEGAGADSVAETLDLLKPDRIAHGVRATEDVALLERLAGLAVVLDICPTSNVRMGVRPGYAALGLPQLKEAGCRFTINTDDPALFGTTLNREYLLAMRYGGLDEADIARCIITAVDAVRLPEEEKAKLRQSIVPEVERLMAGYARS